MTLTEQLPALLNLPIVDHGTHRGIQWAVTAWNKPRNNWHEPYTQYNGYVLIPDTHPWHGTDDHDFGDWDGNSPVDYPSVSGGITFNRSNIWGFDTAHYLDGAGTTYRWTQDMVRDEAIDLADQVADHRNTHTYNI